VNSLLVVLTGSLGDITRGFALLPPIRRRFPNVHISWLAEERWASLVSHHPLVNKTIPFERRERLKGAWKAVRALRLHPYDCALDLQRNLKSGLFTLLSGATQRIGFHRKDSKEGNWLFQSHQIEEAGSTISKTLHYLKFLEALQIPNTTPVDFGLPKLWCREYLPEAVPMSSTRRIGVLLGSSWSSKDWLPEGYAKLIASLTQEPGTTLILLGDSAKMGMANELCALSSSDTSHRIVNLVGRTNLLQLTATLGSLSVCIGPDSGPGHICAALGVPYIGLFGPTSIQRVAPWGCEHLALSSHVGCSPCLRKVCPGLDRICMRLLSVERVEERVLVALSPQRGAV
jgi:heptosyltransferase I